MLKDRSTVSNEDGGVLDWLNLPSGTTTVSLWESLHDAQIVSIRSSLMERTLALSIEIEHLRLFHKLNEGFQFNLHLEGVQSARVLSYAIWPGECASLNGLSHDEQRKVVAEYQAKWREESASWNEFESGVTPENKQVFDISNASLLTTKGGLVALKFGGHLNDTTFHEVFVRAEALKFSGSDRRQFGLEEFQGLGEAYWEAFSQRRKNRK